MTISGRLSARQRSAPPIDRRTARRGRSGGGLDIVEGQRTLAPGLETEQARYPGTVFDSQIVRDRRPWYPVENYIPPPLTWVNWTAAGPPKPQLHMRTVDFRTMVGNSQSRYPYVAGAPTGGMHTMIPSGPGAIGTVDRYVSGNAQMTSARPDRISNARYSGQSYSQTTSVQGRRRG